MAIFCFKHALLLEIHHLSISALSKKFHPENYRDGILRFDLWLFYSKNAQNTEGGYFLIFQTEIAVYFSNGSFCNSSIVQDSVRLACSSLSFLTSAT
jgi:hypothetical protein